MKRRGQAVWTGTLAAGGGILSTESGALAGARYSFATRFGDEAGTNPEELIAAAHAGCFAMALAYLLEAAGIPPERVESAAELRLRLREGRPEVDGIRLRVAARVPGTTDQVFQEIAQKAKEECLVSRLLRTTVELEAALIP